MIILIYTFLIYVFKNSFLVLKMKKLHSVWNATGHAVAAGTIGYTWILMNKVVSISSAGGG